MAACGYHFSAAVTQEGDLLTWGKGNDAQLGLNARDDKLLPTPVSALKSGDGCVCVVMVACGYFHSAAVAEDGVLYTWGAGALGRYDGARTYARARALCSLSSSLSPPLLKHARTHTQ